MRSIGRRIKSSLRVPRLSREAVGATSLKCSKPGRMGLWATWSNGGHPCSWQGVWNQMIFKVPSNLRLSMILWFVIHLCGWKIQFSNQFFTFFLFTFLIFIGSKSKHPSSLSLNRNVNISLWKGYPSLDIYSMCPNMSLRKSQLKEREKGRIIKYCTYSSSVCGNTSGTKQNFENIRFERKTHLLVPTALQKRKTCFLPNSYFSSFHKPSKIVG